MASSDFDTYSRIHCKSVYVSEDGLRLHDNDDDTKTLTLKGPATYQAGNADITLPDSAGALLSDQSTLPGANLAAGSVTAAKLDINGASNVASAADTDEVLVYDASGTSNGKMALSVIKSYVGAGLPTGNTEANILVADGSGDFQSVALSGNATINAAGALSLAANSVDTAEIANNAVTSAKIGVAQVTAPKLALSCIDNANKLADNVVSNNKLAGGIATSKLADGQGSEGVCEASKIMQVDSNKNITGINEAEAVIFNIGGANKWRMIVDASNNLIFQQWDGVDSWDQGGSFSSLI